MIITRIETHDKGKITVSFDTGSPFTVYKKEVSHLNLEPGMELEEAQYQSILNGVLIPRAKKQAMYLLEKMDRTEARLREKLKMNRYPDEAIDEAIAYVKKYHYIDDLRYACNYIRYRCQSKSRRQLFQELYQKGVPKVMIEQAMNQEYQEEDESEKIRRWLEKKQYDPECPDPKQKQRIYQFLLRKGFRSEDILSAI